MLPVYNEKSEINETLRNKFEVTWSFSMSLLVRKIRKGLMMLQGKIDLI